MMVPHTESGAELSPDRVYRYVLWRRWAWMGYAQQVMFIGLNPSTADETHDDATIRKCVGFAKRWGYSGVLMLNAFAFRATKPKNLFAGRRFDDSPVICDNIIGPQNDEALAYRRNQVGLIVAAWGANCPVERERDVCRVIGRPIYCLGTTKSGRPRHPLYLPYDTPPELFWSPPDVSPAGPVR